jgi:hypothetical protein
MARYSALAVSTSYWKPGEDYLSKLTEALVGRATFQAFV